MASCNGHTSIVKMLVEGGGDYSILSRVSCYFSMLSSIVDQCTCRQFLVCLHVHVSSVVKSSNTVLM